MSPKLCLNVVILRRPSFIDLSWRSPGLVLVRVRKQLPTSSDRSGCTSSCVEVEPLCAKTCVFQSCVGLVSGSDSEKFLDLWVRQKFAVIVVIVVSSMCGCGSRVSQVSRVPNPFLRLNTNSRHFKTLKDYLQIEHFITFPIKNISRLWTCFQAMEVCVSKHGEETKHRDAIRRHRIQRYPANSSAKLQWPTQSWCHNRRCWG